MLNIIRKWFEKLFRFFQEKVNDSIYKEIEVHTFQSLNETRNKIDSVASFIFLESFSFFRYNS